MGWNPAAPTTTTNFVFLLVQLWFPVNFSPRGFLGFSKVCKSLCLVIYGKCIRAASYSPSISYLVSKILRGFYYMQNTTLVPTENSDWAGNVRMYITVMRCYRPPLDGLLWGVPGRSCIHYLGKVGVEMNLLMQRLPKGDYVLSEVYEKHNHVLRLSIRSAWATLAMVYKLIKSKQVLFTTRREPMQNIALTYSALVVLFLSRLRSIPQSKSYEQMIDFCLRA